MSTGILAATWLCMVLGQTPQNPAPAPDYFNKRELRIPVANIPPALRVGLKEMRLYASTDQGRSWSQADRITPEKPGFTFYAPRDGTYWLSLATVSEKNVNGKIELVQKPDDRELMTKGPSMIVVIDTLQPIMRSFTVQRDGEDVYVKWDVQEDNPDRGGFVLAYQVKDSFDKWTVVPVQDAPPQGSTKFRAATRQPLIVRLTVRDLAKNESYAEREVEGAVAVVQHTEVPPMIPGTLPQKNEPPTLPVQMQLPAAMPGPSGPPPPVAPFPLPPNPEPQVHKVQSVGPAPLNERPPVSLDSGPHEKVIADSRLQPEMPKLPAPGVAPAIPGGLQPGLFDGPPAVSMPQRALPEVQHINRHDVKLQYRLKRVGPSGVGGLQIWLTKDDGQTWKPFAEDRDPHIDSITGNHEDTFRFRDDAPFPDGVYGLKLVVMNRAGLGRTPKSGDLPDIRVEIDTQLPVARLYKPSADPHRKDHVLLKWFAEDKNLTATPITLEYAETRDGPWKAIQADIANRGQHTSREVTGDFSWQIPPNLPVQVYLRLRVRDKAGNESIAASGSPEFLDLTEPEGALIGVQVK